MKLLINFPSRQRPEQVLYCISNIRSRAAQKDFVILLKLDFDDEKCNSPEFKKKLNDIWDTDLLITWGHSKNKIHAVNRGVNEATIDWDILLSHSDDFIFIKPFDEIISRDMQEYFPDLDGVLHYPDGFMGPRVMTYSIIGRKYFERSKKIYHTDYESWYADADATEAAKQINRYKYIDNQIFVHRHPKNMAVPTDELYIKNDDMVLRGKDRNIFLHRQLEKFRS